MSRLFSLDDIAASRTKHKFDIAYLIAKENMAFAKMVPCANLRKGTAETLGRAIKMSLHTLAQEQCQGLAASLSRARFFGLQADGSTDTGNIEDKVFLAVYCDPRAADGRVHVHRIFI